MYLVSCAVVSLFYPACFLSFGACLFLLTKVPNLYVGKINQKFASQEKETQKGKNQREEGIRQITT
jgi:hypothetical protein